MSVARWGQWFLCACTAVVASCNGGDAAAVTDAGHDTDADAASCVATTTPPSVTGVCSATSTEESRRPTGDDGAGGFILPDGRRLTRVGTPVLLSGFPMRVRSVAGTDFVVVTDGGIHTEVLSVINVATHEVVDQESFTGNDRALFLGLEVDAARGRVWASGGGSNHVWAFDLDVSTGQLSAAPSRDIQVGLPSGQGYVSGLAVLPSGDVAVSLLFEQVVVVYDGETGAEQTRVSTGERSYPYDLVASPDGETLFVSLWNQLGVLPIRLGTESAGTMIPTGKNPEGLAISPDGTRVVATASDSDSFSVIDVATQTLIDTVPITPESELRGSSPSSAAFGADGKLYVVLAGTNAIAVYEPIEGGGYAQIGRIPTMWYPTDVAVLPDGRVLVLNGKNMGTGPNDGTHDVLDLLGGSLNVVDAEELTPENLAAWDAEIELNNTRAVSFSSVTCPEGAPDDFPIPQPGQGASTKIKHVVLVVRENKTYDAYFGDLTDDSGAPHGNGAQNLTLVPRERIEQVLANTRSLARTFAMGDNYYSDAEQSCQGHVWTTFGRTTDFVERSWLTTWGRGYWPVPGQGVGAAMGSPEEGGAFEYFDAHHIDQANFGELVGIGDSSATPQPRYPGYVFSLDTTDRARGTFLADWWKNKCGLASFSYVIMPRDHTFGLGAGEPTPSSMIADNDEGVGLIADALSHSTYWPETLVVVIEDDPQDGADHVDNHRSPLILISPWVKRGYVSSVHYNEASIYRTIQLIFGIDEPLNESWANAAPMYDAFTSTPDFTPYDRIERQWPEENNPDDHSAAALRSLEWDFSQPDEQPGLSEMLWEHFHKARPSWHSAPDFDDRFESDADGDADDDD